MKRINMFMAVIVVAVCLLMSGIAFAQVEPAAQKVIYKQVTILDYVEGLRTVGEIVGPNNSFLKVKRNPSFKPLIPVRDNFLPEIMHTVGNL